MKDLHEFQAEAINALRQGYRDGHRCQLLAMPTGSGKTVVATHMIRNAARKGRTSMFVVAQIELIDQAARHLRELGLQVGILQGEQTALSPDDEVVVASIQTVSSRGAPPAGFVIIDEAHVLHRAHINLMQDWSTVPFIGLSATPLRPDLGRYFTHLVRGPSVAWMIEHNFLSPVRAYCPAARRLDALLGGLAVRRGDYVETDLAAAMNRAELVGDIVRTWQEEAEDRPTLCFAVNIAHSQAICQDFQAAGVAAAHLDAYTPREVRKETIAAFRAGELRVLSSVNVLGIGFDVPDAACAVLARPTLSEALHMQQMGRVIRKAPDKAEALILDHAGNTVRLGLPQHFAVPDLGTQATSTRAKRNEQRLVTCPACGAVLEPEQRTCPGCGITRAPRTTRVGVAPGELVLHDGSAPAQETYSEAERFNWYAALLGHAKRLNFKPGWAFFAYQAKFGAKPPWAWRSARPREPDREQKRWIRRYYKDSKRNAAAHKSAL